MKKPLQFQIAVPDIATIIATYNVIRVFRSTTTRDGPWTEITSAAPTTAKITGTVVGPFTSLNGKTLILRVKTSGGQYPDIAVSFVGANPISTASAAAEIAAAGTGFLTAVDDGSGHVQIQTLATGSSTTLDVVGGDGLADLGLALYQRGYGTDPFIALAAQDTAYDVMDPTGDLAYWYRWTFYHTGTLAQSAATMSIQGPDSRIDPVRKIEDFRATRGLTLVRTREHTFRMAFWEDQAAGVPLVPLDANKYPAYAIIDINGLTVQDGKAEIDGSAPNYRVSFTPAIDAPLTADDRHWRIDWFLVTDLNRTVQSSQPFDVRDVDITESEIKEQKVISLDGAAKRMRYSSENRPSSLSLIVEEAGNPSIQVLALPAVFPPSGPNPSLTEIQDGDRYVYYYDVPANSLTAGANGNTYQAIWTKFDTPSSEEVMEFQIIDVIPRTTLQYFPQIRMVIDKFQKQRDMLQAYQDSDIFEYLTQGLRWVNGMSPAHLAWNMTGVPTVVQPYWLLAATWWGLNAQQGLEIDLNFDSSGQTVTLGYNHADALASWSDRFKQALQEGFAPLKMQLYRKSSPVGSYSGRSMRRTGINNYVIPISRDAAGVGVGAGNSLLGLVSQIGLIFLPFLVLNFGFFG